ncbi:hypothetical protein EYC79_20590 [Agrobacterium cavarae]|uniref:Uncharacterized protein n=1 Tax=Agrobacterium cavarae TaxID=2528239 RepID=A0ABY1Y418_9HYPH|nr:hypothetical protein EYC79_20590 [Agrobacterium cavarae]
MTNAVGNALPSTLIPVLVTGIQPTRVCAARKRSFSPKTWSDWIPVTSTGMRTEVFGAPVNPRQSPSGEDDGEEKLNLNA